MNIPNQNDKLWEKVVKARAGYKCLSCGKTKGLHAHHIVTRTHYSSRWLLLNGVCLCAKCHEKAHINEEEFRAWLISSGTRTDEELKYINEKRIIDKVVMNQLLIKAAENFKII